jgi:biopolymer transport protein ExbD
LKSRIEAEPINLGFQIAAMIDIVFVIMLFFMVMAGSMKMERQFNMALPSTTIISDDFGLTPVEEVLLTIDEEGVVYLNYDEVGAPEDAKLESLASQLEGIRKNASDGGLKVLATLQTDEAAPYQRVIEVMNALAKAKISNLTFTVSEDQN